MNNKKARGLNGVVFLVFVVFLFAALWFTNQFDQREKEISWKKFQQLVQNDKIESVEVNQNKSVPTGRVEITLKGDDSSDNVRYLYVSDVNEIQDYLKEQNVDYTMPDIPQDSWASNYISAGYPYTGRSVPDLWSDEPSGRRGQFESNEFRKEPCKTEHRP